MRIVSLAALFDALELFEQLDDPTLINRLIGVFKPKEYTRIDDIIALANQFADDRSVTTTTPNNPEGDGNKLPKQTNETEVKNNKIARTQDTNPSEIARVRQHVVKRFSKKLGFSFLGKKASFTTDSDDYRFVVAVSKKYNRRDMYWYACHKRQLSFIAEAKKVGYFILSCLDTEAAYAIPYNDMNAFVTNMLTTPPKDGRYYHVVIRKEDNREFLFVHPTKEEIELSKYKFD